MHTANLNSNFHFMKNLTFSLGASYTYLDGKNVTGADVVGSKFELNKYSANCSIQFSFDLFESEQKQEFLVDRLQVDTGAGDIVGGGCAGGSCSL